MVEYEQDEKKSVETVENQDMPWIQHLEELRWRIIYSLTAIAAGSCIAYAFIDRIMYYLMLPAGKLYYMQPSEAFFTYMKVSVFAGFLLALPVVLYQVWRFLLPALLPRERLALGLIVPLSLLLFLSGVAFAFFLALPAGLRFFMSFGDGMLQPMLSIGQYFDFVFSFTLPFGLVFELPLFIVLLAKFRLISSDFLRRKRRILIFLSFVVGAVLSPTPDAFSQSLLAVPMIFLYEISLWIVRYVLHR